MALLEMNKGKDKGKDKVAAAPADGGKKSLFTKKGKAAKAPAYKPFVASLPTVDLLPPDVKEEVELRRLRRLFVVAGVIVLGLMVAAWVLQAGLIHVAQNGLDQQNARTQALNGQMAKLTPVKLFYAQVDTNQTTIQQTMDAEVLTSKVLAELDKTTPHGVSLGNVTVSLDGSSTPAAAAATPTTGAGDSSACPSPDPFTQAAATAGCITVDGSAASRTALGQWIDKAAADPMFTAVFVPTATSDETGKITFSGSLALSDKVHEHRYANVNFLKGGN